MISPNADKLNAPDADTATVPEALGREIVLSDIVGSTACRIVSTVSSVVPSKDIDFPAPSSKACEGTVVPMPTLPVVLSTNN